MLKHFLFKLIVCFSFISPLNVLHAAEENFIILDGITSEVVFELGPNINERISPCSTFKIALSLMGYEVGILIDANNPIWDFQEGYDDFLEVWKSPQTPQSWMKYSCIWYSRVLVSQIGSDQVQSYLDLLEYGNRDISRGLTKAWVNSSIKISPKEQVEFIRKVLHGYFPISENSIQMTKKILFLEELPEGYKLFGKTGWGGSVKETDDKNFEIAWFVGWIEKDDRIFPFAYNIREDRIDLGQRIPRVKQLISNSKIL